MKESILAKVFDTYWSQFEIDLKKIIETTPETEIQAKRKDNDIMLDVLSTVRTLDRRLRSIESTNERQYISVSEKENVMRDNFSLNELRMTIQNLVEQDLPDQVILDILSDKTGVPRTIIRKELTRYRDLKETKTDKK